VTRWIVGAAGVTVLLLFVLLVHDLLTGRALAEFADDSALTVRVTGRQWWWQFEYQDPVPNRRVLTANELHVPVGRKIRVDVASRDVIHSFWAPELFGKLDLIPGYTGTTYFRADRAGVYRGRCAEFCGLQHAHMDFLIVAEPAARFDAWYEGQLKAGKTPADTLLQKGQHVFLTKGCVLCHAVRGTPADSRVGPDLTHLASRATIASGTLPRNRRSLEGWILDPQRIKPGVRMPPTSFEPGQLDALLSYLESLN
jgi:cytochrome c oxidase subunit 2